MPYLIILFLFVLVFLSAFFSASETALTTANRFKLRNKALKKSESAQQVLTVLKKPERLLVAILIGNTLVNVICSSLATWAALRYLGQFGVAIASTGVTIFILLFAEILPKTMAALRPEPLACFLIWPLKVMLFLLQPLVYTMHKASQLVMTIIGWRHRSRSDDFNEEELDTVVRESKHLMTNKNHMLLLRALELRKASVDEVMVPRQLIIGIDLKEPLSQIILQLEQFEYQVLPVYVGEINHIVGVVRAIDVYKLHLQNKLTEKNIKTMMESPYFVPAGTSINVQLVQFQEKKDKMAFVVDEYGDLLGLVTLSNIIDALIGTYHKNIEQELFGWHKTEDGAFIGHGGCSLREINLEMNWKLPLEGPLTVNGLVLEILEQIPDGPVEVLLPNYIISCQEIAKRRVRKLVITERKDQKKQS